MGVTECENCGAELAPLDKVVVWREARRADIGYSYVQARGCERCADSALAEERKRRGFSLRRAVRLMGGDPGLHVRLAECHYCKRDMAFATEIDYGPEYVRRAYCSDSCRDASRKLARSRRPRPLGICETCGVTFVPARSDAKTCSPACRQKAYRQRLQVVPKDSQPADPGVLVETAPPSEESAPQSIPDSEDAALRKQIKRLRAAARRRERKVEDFEVAAHLQGHTLTDAEWKTVEEILGEAEELSLRADDLAYELSHRRASGE